MIKQISLFQENVAILSVVYYQQKVFKSVASFVKCCSWFPENNSPNIEVRLRSAVPATITWSNLDRQGLGLAASKMHPKFGPKMHSPFFASFACKVNTYPAQCCPNWHKACQWSSSCNCKSKHWVFVMSPKCYFTNFLRWEWTEIFSIPQSSLFPFRPLEMVCWRAPSKIQHHVLR